MDAKQEDILRDAYEQWMLHPITKQLLSNLSKHKQRFVDKLADNAHTLAETEMRVLSCGLRDTQTIIKMIEDYNVFKTLV